METRNPTIVKILEEKSSIIEIDIPVFQRWKEKWKIMVY